MRRSLRWTLRPTGESEIRAFVTGGSGYFGSLLLRKLLARDTRARSSISPMPRTARERCVSKADIRDYEAVVRAVAGADAVFHNVAQVRWQRIASCSSP